MYLIISVVMGRCIGAFLPIRDFSSWGGVACVCFLLLLSFLFVGFVWFGFCFVLILKGVLYLQLSC